MAFVISFPFLSIFVTSFSTGTEKVMYFSVFSLKELSCPSNPYAGSFMMKW